MPIYLYQEIKVNGEGEVFEIEHSAAISPLTRHPETGIPLKKVYVAPALNIRYTEGKTKKLLDNKNLEKNGFTKYQKDKISGQYHKVAGKEGPEYFSS